MEVTESEQRDARIILVAFFGQEAAKWPINHRVIDVLGEMLSRNRKCAEVMDLLPRPGFIDKGYLRRQLQGIARRILSGDKSYRICEIALSSGWKSKIRLASMGL